MIKRRKFVLLSAEEDLNSVGVLPLPRSDEEEAERDLRMAVYAAVYGAVAEAVGLSVIDVTSYSALVDEPEDRIVGLDVMQQIWDLIDVGEDERGRFVLTVRTRIPEALREVMREED